MHFVLASLLAAATATPAFAGESVRYLELINRAHDRVVSLAIAAAGEAVFHEVPLDRGLRGGGASATIQFAEEACRVDLRLGFADGRSVLYRDFDVCRSASLRIAKLPSVSEDVAAKPLLARRSDR